MQIWLPLIMHKIHKDWVVPELVLSNLSHVYYIYNLQINRLANNTHKLLLTTCHARHLTTLTSLVLPLTKPADSFSPVGAHVWLCWCSSDRQHHHTSLTKYFFNRRCVVWIGREFLDAAKPTPQLDLLSASGWKNNQTNTVPDSSLGSTVLDHRKRWFNTRCATHYDMSSSYLKCKLSGSQSGPL